MSMFMYYIVRRHFSGLGHPDFNRSSVSVLPPVWFKALRNAVTVQRRTMKAMRRMCITEKGGRGPDGPTGESISTSIPHRGFARRVPSCGAL